jgi:serine/threonine protein kinase
MHPQPDSKCVECGEPAPPTAPRGLCVGCFQKSTGLGPGEYQQSTSTDQATTLPVRSPQDPGSRREPATRPLQPEQTFGQGRFTLVRRLGKGGMGEVWLATDRDLTEGGAPCLVALKFLLASEIRRDPEKLNWLRREVLATRGLNHDNIVKVFDLHASSPSEPAFLAMEYVEGATLEDRLLRKPKHYFPWDDLCPFARQICAALEYAHDRGVFHRDLKPRNILVASNSDETKLADFGLARRLSASESDGSRLGSGAGTRGYMSPQQASGHRPTKFDDIYALGATLYRLLTGELPEFRESKSGGKTSLSLVPMSERLAAKGPFRVPDQVEKIVRQCLEDQPFDRPATVYEVAAGLGFTSPHPSPRSVPVGQPKSAKAGAFRRTFAALLVFGALLAVLAFVVLQPEFREFLDRVVPRRQPVLRVDDSPPRPSSPMVSLPLSLVTNSAVPAGSSFPSNPPSPTASAAVPVLKTPESEPQSPEVAESEAAGPANLQPRVGKRWTNSIGMEFLPIPKLPLLVSRLETRVADFRRMEPKHPLASFQTVGASNHPLVYVTWIQATNFCHWLTTQERKSGLLGDHQEYRLPTIGEWMQAAGASVEGTTSAGLNHARQQAFLWGTSWPPPPDVGNLLGDEIQGVTGFANREDRIRQRLDGASFTAAAGMYPPNSNGLSDMIGNVWELCLDGPSTSQCWSVGGSFNSGSRKELNAGFRRQASTRRREPQTDDWDTGFRCVLDPGMADESTPPSQPSP